MGPYRLVMSVATDEPAQPAPTDASMTTRVASATRDVAQVESLTATAFELAPVVLIVVVAALVIGVVRRI